MIKRAANEYDLDGWSKQAADLTPPIDTTVEQARSEQTRSNAPPMITDEMVYQLRGSTRTRRAAPRCSGGHCR
jgi:hypothetical protein